MSLNVALIDKSEIIKKMLSHSLHYYAAEIHRFETLDELKSQAKHLKPDIVFIDWEMNKESSSLALSAKEEFKDTPLVVIYRSGIDQSTIPIANKIKKPLNVSLLRKMVEDLIPKIRTSKIHKFLKYPTHEFSNEPKDTEITDFIKQVPPTLNLDLPNLEGSEIKIDIPSKISDYKNETPEKKTKTNKVEFLKINPEKKSEAKETASKENNTTPLFDRDKDEFLKINPEKKSEAKETASKENNTTPLFDRDKDDLNLDESTLNDFAPMAIKSSFNEETNITQLKNDIKNLKKDELVLKVLEEYKNTLEFENIIEKNIKASAQNLVKKILETDQKEIIQKSLSELKKEDSFKKLILTTLSEYVKNNSEFRTLFEKELHQFITNDLPRLTKEIIEKEIKNILAEKN